MVHSNDDAMNKIPLKSTAGLDDEEKNGGEFINDTAAAEEARREQMRANLLVWMKKLTIVLICFIGIALISYVIISLCFSDWSKSTSSSSSTSNSSLLSDDNSHSSNNNNNINNINNNNNITNATHSNSSTSATQVASFGFSDRHVAEATTVPVIAAVSSSSSVQPAPTTVSTATTATTAEMPQTTPNDAPAQPAAFLDTPPNTDSKFVSKLGVYGKAAVCSDRTVCSQIGSNLLEQGGSVVDSAIGALLCNGILSMQSMGIGGGMLMNVYIKDKKHAYSIDAREVAPFAADPNMFDRNANLSLHGGLAIGVPGELMGYYRAHERFGKLPWNVLVEPSIKLCNDGYYLSEHQWNSLKYKSDHFKNETVLTKVFFNSETGEIHPVGTKIKPPQALCETFMLLAKNGPLDFYNGTLAQLVVEDLKELGSTVTAYDLESYGADLVSSITMQLGSDILYAIPPISSGTVSANILSILEGYNFTKADLMGDENEANTIHRFVEAMKFGFAKRWELGDLRFNDVRELVSKLTNPDYGSNIRAQINDSSVLDSIFAYGAEFMGVDDVGTSSIVILAPNGDAVSVTSSINDYFGSGQAGKRTGIIFNSAMNDFSVTGQSNLFGFPPAPSNFIEARKRPMSSMSPMILADEKGDIRLLVGAAGGSKIISAVIEVMARVLWFEQDIKQAIDAPRFHNQLMPNVLEYQLDGFSDEIIKLLEAKGHKLTGQSSAGSVVCGIVQNETAIYVNADYRKQGGISGF